MIEGIITEYSITFETAISSSNKLPFSMYELVLNKLDNTSTRYKKICTKPETTVPTVNPVKTTAANLLNITTIF